MQPQRQAKQGDETDAGDDRGRRPGQPRRPYRDMGDSAGARMILHSDVLEEAARWPRYWKRAKARPAPRTTDHLTGIVLVE
jgi:hypothetical protein